LVLIFKIPCSPTMKTIFLIALCLVAANAFVCLPNTCASVDCLAVENCADGEVMKGVCGCCDVCVKYLKEGDRCIPEGLLGVPSTSKCGLKLVCSSRTMTCIKPLAYDGVKTCHQLKSETEKAGLLGAFIPRCETDGTFSRVQCHGSECFCSHSDGTQIPGFKAPIHESQDMDCNCARDQFEYLKTKLVGKMFRCEPNGNYNKVQCLGSACYCVDKLGKQVGGSVHISKSESMNC
ncbi:nidogen-2-like, partial [Argonauta hians]